jgi:primosomal protein N' (replication factor Y)
MSRYAEVVFPLPLVQRFTYLIPEELAGRARLGCRVLAPLGSRLLTGFIVHLRDRVPERPLPLKDIKILLDDEPIFPLHFLSFTYRLSRLYRSSWGEMLASSLPASFSLPDESRVALTSKGEADFREGKMHGEEGKLAVVLAGKAYRPRYLRRKLGKNPASVLARMEAKGLVRILPLPARKKSKTEKVRRRPERPRQLALEFSAAPGLETLLEAVAQGPRPGAFSSPFYLFGSRENREVAYFQLIRASVSRSGRTLFLLPEIWPSGDLLRKIEERLPGKAVALHSRLTEAQEEEARLRIRSGEASVVAGPRSALFALLPGLRLIILDQEQDESYYQTESPSYDARWGARLLGRTSGATVVFGSSRPSVESFHQAVAQGRLVRLGREPAGGQSLVVDARREKSFISKALVEALRAGFARREQMAVFLNRRGYAAALVCGRCGLIPRCRRCDIALTYLKQKNALVCRYCSESVPVWRTCPSCGGPLRLGRQLGVEAVAEEIRRLFPQMKTAVFDSGLVPALTEQRKILENFRRGRIDLLVGTQLLTSRPEGLHLRLAAVLFPEWQLGLPDYRAGQKTYGALRRIMDLASGPSSRIIIQTALPEHHAIAAAATGDYELFYRAEVEFRRVMNYPPFAHLAEVMFEGREIRSLARQARLFRDGAAAAAKSVEVLGPARAAVPRIKGFHRIQVLLRSAARRDLEGILEDCLPRTRMVRSVHLYP